MFKKYSVILFSLFAMSFSGLLGCSTTYPLKGTRLSPASSGEVIVSTDANDNQVLKINVRFMPLPQDLDPELTTFIAWASPSDKDTFSNLGQLKFSEEDREAELSTTTPYPDLTLIISAEKEAFVTQPSEFVVFKQQVVAK